MIGGIFEGSAMETTFRNEVVRRRVVNEGVRFGFLGESEFPGFLKLDERGRSGNVV